MRKEIATVRLNRGEVGFYDDLTHIHLTIGAPTAKLYSGMNLSHVRRAIRNGVLVLVSGTLAEKEKPLKLIKKGSGFILMKNDGKKEHVPEKNTTPPVKTAPELPAVDEQKNAQEPAKAVPAEKEKKVPESIEKEKTVIEEGKAAPAAEAKQEEAVAEGASSEPTEEKPKKRGRKKKGSSEEDHADSEIAAQDEPKSEDVSDELS